MVLGSSSTKCFLNLFKLKAFRIFLNGSSGLVIKAGTDLIEFTHPREDIDTDLLVEIQQIDQDPIFPDQSFFD